MKCTTDIYDITLMGLHREVKCAKRLYNKKKTSSGSEVQALRWGEYGYIVKMY